MKFRAKRPATSASKRGYNDRRTYKKPRRFIMNFSKKNATLLILFFTFLLTNLAFAHADHGTVLTDEQVVMKATADVGRMVKEGKKVDGKVLDKSWLEVTDKKISDRNLRYVVVSFKRPNKKEVLYVFLDVYGLYLGANFSGSIEDI